MALKCTRTRNRGDEEQTYAKQQLCVKEEETKLLGLMWTRDSIHVSLSTQAAEPIKSSILANIAKIYDPIGLVSPITLTSKILYRDAHDLQGAWDAPATWVINGQSGRRVCRDNLLYRLVWPA